MVRIMCLSMIVVQQIEDAVQRNGLVKPILRIHGLTPVDRRSHIVSVIGQIGQCVR